MQIDETFLSKISNNGWREIDPGYYLSSGKMVSYQKYFRLFTRSHKLSEYLKRFGDFSKKFPKGVPANPSKYTGFEADPNPTMGYPNLDLGPEEKIAPQTSSESSKSLPQLAHFEKLPSFQMGRKCADCMLIGFDSEWVSSETRQPTDMLTWQAAVIQGEELLEFIWVRVGTRPLSIDLIVGRILDYCGCEPIDYRELSASRSHSDKKQKKNCAYSKKRITVVCHSGKADLSSLARSKTKSTDILHRCHHVQGGAVTLEPMSLLIKSLKPQTGHHIKVFPVLLKFADTMCHTPAKRKSLEQLGNVVKIPKIEVPSSRIGHENKPIDYKAHMDLLLEDDPCFFFEYASNDAVIALLYTSAIYGYNKEVPVTITSAASTTMKQIMMDYFGVSDTAAFNRIYRGLQFIDHGLVQKNNTLGFLKAESLEPINHQAWLVQDFAAKAFHGGLNGSMQIGYYPEATYDYDLRSAYPTAMCLIPDIDWAHPVKYEIKNRVLSLDDWIVPDEGRDPFLPLLAYVRFDFPEDCKYTTIPIKESGIPVYVKHSKDISGVYACGPELYLAVLLGAKVYCEQGYVLNTRIDPSTMGKSYALRHAVYQMVQDRDAAKALYGSDSLEEQILKTMVNSGYGKTAQNVIPKHTWNIYYHEMRDQGCSSITNPVSACFTTSIVRAVLQAALIQLTQMGYSCYSVTTDGFISNAPEEVLLSLDLLGLSNAMAEARSFLSGGRSTALWDKKHWQTDLINFTTRGNVSLQPNGVCAHNGCRSGFVENSYEDRLWLRKSVLSRTGKVSYTEQQWTSFSDLCEGKPFSVKKITRSVTMDFDFKRKPTRCSFVFTQCVLDAIQTNDIYEYKYITIRIKHTASERSKICRIYMGESGKSVIASRVIKSLSTRVMKP